MSCIRSNTISVKINNHTIDIGNNTIGINIDTGSNTISVIKIDRTIIRSKINNGPNIATEATCTRLTSGTGTISVTDTCAATWPISPSGR